MTLLPVSVLEPVMANRVVAVAGVVGVTVVVVWMTVNGGPPMVVDVVSLGNVLTGVPTVVVVDGSVVVVTASAVVVVDWTVVVVTGTVVVVVCSVVVVTGIVEVVVVVGQPQVTSAAKCVSS